MKREKEENSEDSEDLSILEEGDTPRQDEGQHMGAGQMGRKMSRVNSSDGGRSAELVTSCGDNEESRDDSVSSSGVDVLLL